MNRRGFLRSTLAGIAVAIAAPILARFAPKQAPDPRYLALRDLLNGAPAYEVLNVSTEFREFPKPRGSVIRFRRDPTKVFEL